MATRISQSVVSTGRDQSVVTTLVRLVSASDAFDLPQMIANSNSVVQLRRPGDAAVTVTQDDTRQVTITGGVADQEVQLVSLHNDPIVNATVNA